ncbi:MAG: hypothetical protein VB071_14895 [Lawsonibacter sp.]|nr:hypothetical protein [Lawsonibacter sp.]
MEQLLRQEGTLEFLVSDTFEAAMLSPIIQNLLVKAEHEWDDYDEVYHCCQMVEAVRREDRLRMKFHFLRRNGCVVGVGLMTGGQIVCPLFFPDHLFPPEPREGLFVFNYFHVAPGARGVGSRWLREVILPYCRAQGGRTVYIKSSHPMVFSLYARLGSEVGHYSARSDNGLFERPGTLFRIDLDPQ